MPRRWTKAPRIPPRSCPGWPRPAFRLGVPASQGGLEGSDAGDAIEAVSQLAEHSVAAAFVAWGQRVFIEYLLHSPNQALARDWTGRCCAASWPAPRRCPTP